MQAGSITRRAVRRALQRAYREAIAGRPKAGAQQPSAANKCEMLAGYVICILCNLIPSSGLAKAYIGHRACTMYEVHAMYMKWLTVGQQAGAVGGRRIYLLVYFILFYFYFV